MVCIGPSGSLRGAFGDEAPIKRPLSREKYIRIAREKRDLLQMKRWMHCLFWFNVIPVVAIADFFILRVSALAAPSTHQDQGHRGEPPLL
jgi:hypothetical protein